ncbi:MAG: hypothetical protein QOF81_3566, partial [Acidimicrobiaceae bacterium]|nr:hypothetical protein [Acidimicrobiaceae bacterium]
ITARLAREVTPGSVVGAGGADAAVFLGVFWVRAGLGTRPDAPPDGRGEVC